MEKKIYTDRPMRSHFMKRADFDKAVLDYQAKNVETEADGVRAGALRLLRESRRFKGVK